MESDQSEEHTEHKKNCNGEKAMLETSIDPASKSDHDRIGLLELCGDHIILTMNLQLPRHISKGTDSGVEKS